uniref:Uncharacterized protein n=1 Tax=Ananas comosus var. bracteatus TaxID=296719 RepID=A0A6V7NKK5_ANACO|nr:unnamed protein product [Ananas comosus var. bracteatus]
MLLQKHKLQIGPFITRIGKLISGSYPSKAPDVYLLCQLDLPSLLCHNHVVFVLANQLVKHKKIISYHNQAETNPLKVNLDPFISYRVQLKTYKTINSNLSNCRDKNLRSSTQLKWGNTISIKVRSLQMIT